MRCSKCGNKIKHSATFCTHCGQKILHDSFVGDNSENRSSFNQHKPYKKYLFIGIAVLGCFIYFFGFRCKAGLCPLLSIFSGDYCSTHTCGRDDCTNKKAVDRNYCYTHSPSYPSDYSYTPELAEDVLDFSDISITHNSSYTVCTGAITNNGRRTYTFVEVKGKFKDSSGKVLDSDWTYAVGSEGLAPGESTTFRISVDKNRSITKCTMEIIDYDRK